MSITASSKTYGEDNALTNSFNTPAITTYTDRLYIMSVQILHYPEISGSNIVSISTSGGVMWTKATSIMFGGIYPTETWYGYCTAGSGSVSWTVTMGTTPSTIASRVYVIDEISGVSESGSIVQYGTAGATTSPVTATLSDFSQPANASYVYGCVSGSEPSTIDVEGGYSSITSTGISTYGMVSKTGYFIGTDTSPSFTFSGTATCDIIALEIKALDAGSLKNSLMLMGCGT